MATVTDPAREQAIGQGRQHAVIGRDGSSRADPEPPSGGLVSPLATYLAQVHARHRTDAGGTVADYIPELGKADPAWFGIAAATLDGAVHEVGDARVPFTIQSISKPLTYALVLDDLGETAVRARIGVEPTGDAFNAITLDRAGRPLNPMVNAGAITAAGLVRGDGDGPGDALERILAGYGRFAGRPVQVDPAVAESERATGHRNRAIGHLLRASGVLDGDADEAVERYFAQCSVSVTAADLAVIAATLANGGVNPLTGVRAASPEAVRSVLAVMSSCGMYDGAGEWLYAIGLPAKSGVAGGILAVVPGRLGLGFFSPPLDAQGNSVRGTKACQDIVRDLQVHPLGETARSGRWVRCIYTAADVGSSRRRTLAERRALASTGDRALVLELQGVLTFLAMEAIAAAARAAVSSGGEPLAMLVLDLRRVDRIDDAAIPFLAEVCAAVAMAGGRVLLSSAERHGAAIAQLAAAVPAQAAQPEGIRDLDTALEIAEDALLAATGVTAEQVLDSWAHPLLAGVAETERAAVIEGLEQRSWPTGSTIVHAGDPSTEVYLVLAGRLSVTIEVPGQGRRRLSTLGAGMVFGETALLGGGRRGADVHADGPVDCLVLTAAAFEQLSVERPGAALAILRSLLGTAIATTGRLTRELAVLAG